MYSTKDLALPPTVPNENLIASFDLNNYQQLPVLDNISFGPEDGDFDQATTSPRKKSLGNHHSFSLK